MALPGLPPWEPLAPCERFELIRRVGAGGMGVVWEAFDLERGETVALKTPPGPAPDQLAMLKHEFRVLADLDHRNVVRVHELIELDGTWFLSMALVDGVPLPEWVFGATAAAAVGVVRVTPDGVVDPRVLAEAGDTEPSIDPGRTRAPGARRAQPRSRPVTAAEAERIRACLRQVAAGLAAVHAAGKIHGDVKPGNVLVTEGGRVVLVDFGLAREERAPGPLWQRPGGIAGTPVYLSPEQAAGQPPSAASDIYALGAVLYELLTGVPPFEGDVGELLTRRRFADPRPAAERVPGTPAALSALCAELLQRDPARRPSAAVLFARLDVARRPPAATPRPGRWSDATPAAGAAALATVCPPRPAVIHVQGPSGAGKTAALAAHRAAATPLGTVVLHARCDARERVPLQALAALVDSLVVHLAQLPPAAAAALVPPGAAALVRRFPMLRAVDPLAAEVARTAPPEEWCGAAEDVALALEGLRALLVHLTASAPLVIELDDAQACDPASAAALAGFVAAPDPLQALIVLAHTADGLDADRREALAVLDATVGPGRVWTLDLGPPTTALPTLRRGRAGARAEGGGLLAWLRGLGRA